MIMIYMYTKEVKKNVHSWEKNMISRQIFCIVIAVAAQCYSTNNTMVPNIFDNRKSFKEFEDCSKSFHEN